MRNLLRSIVGGLLLAATLAGSAATSAVGGSGSAPALGQYIVVLKEGTAGPAQIAAEHGKAHGFEARFVYRHALRGYAATLPAAAAAAITNRPGVLSVTEDGEVWAQQADQPPQTVSNGVLRIDGDRSSTRSGDGRRSVDINVAILDDGIDASHPDLNVQGQTSCISRGMPNSSGSPSGWHGTMVGGFIGALDNEIGRVGVAPGARLWAVKVIDDRGFGTNSEIICGLEWVASTLDDSDPTNDIDVVNMSLGGPAGHGTGSCPGSGNDAFQTAHCSLVAAGVTIVAAAGNESADFQRLAPATYDDVLTATAVSDQDGQAGGLGGQLTCLPSEIDDTAATFSNFATLPSDRAHTVAAPGSCIGSTYPGGQYAIASGTSFSTPLVAGTVALCIASGPCAGLAPRQIIQKIVGDAAAYNTARRNSGYGFAGDPLRPAGSRYYGYLIRAGLY